MVDDTIWLFGLEWRVFSHSDGLWMGCTPCYPAPTEMKWWRVLPEQSRFAIDIHQKNHDLMSYHVFRDVPTIWSMFREHN